MKRYSIDQAREIVKYAGFDISDSRFPFTYHHDWVRNQGSNALMSRSDVAIALRRDYPDDAQYERVAIRGALLFLAHQGVFPSAFSNSDGFRALFAWAMS